MRECPSRCFEYIVIVHLPRYPGERKAPLITHRAIRGAGLLAWGRAYDSAIAAFGSM